MNKEDEAVLKETFTRRITIGGDCMPTIAEAWIEQGKAEVKEEMVDKMIELGMNNSDIRKITGLSLKRINELREKK
jgi:hypothetical protein